MFNLSKCGAGGAEGLPNRDAVQAYFTAAMPLSEINMSLRRNFLMFLRGCNLHDLPMPDHAEVIGPKSVIKGLTMPYFDRALLEFVHHIRG